MKSPAQLNALRAFEASARHQSFSAAAAELHVTPAAVGQLVRSLEELLGAPLFHRGTGGRSRLVATPIAERALPDIRAGFDRLALGWQRLHEGSANGVLTVTVSPAFAAKWLLPRIDRFQAAWPDTDVLLDTNHKPVDFVAQRVDIGVRGVAATRGMRINNSAAVLQAAAEGHGIALARSVMARDDLAAGRLVRLFADIAFASSLAYYGVYRPECASLPRLAAFRAWLISEARA